MPLQRRKGEILPGSIGAFAQDVLGCSADRRNDGEPYSHIPEAIDNVTDDEYQKYLNDRYQTLLAFYDTRAQQNKLGHRACSVFIIGMSGILAPLIGTGALLKHAMLGAFMSASVVIATAITSHFQFNENWLGYRRTWDALKRELFLRDARVGDYANTSDRNVLFVQRVEAVASDEGAEWYGRHRRQQERSGADNAASSEARKKEKAQ